jgi:hypothetical protein
MNVYMQEIPKSVQATVDSINSELRKKSTSVRERKPTVVNQHEQLTSSQFRRSHSVLLPNATNRWVGKFVTN